MKKEFIKPLAAMETGLVPKGWTVESDDLEGDIDPTKLDFGYSPCGEDESSISGDTMLKRTKATANTIGSLGFGADVLKAQKEGKDIIPPELKGKKYIILPKTILRDDDGSRRVGCLLGGGGQWVLPFLWIDVGGFGSDGVVARVRESLDTLTPGSSASPLVLPLELVINGITYTRK